MKNAPIGTTIPGTVGHSIAHTGMLTRNVMIIDQNKCIYIVQKGMRDVYNCNTVESLGPIFVDYNNFVHLQGCNFMDASVTISVTKITLHKFVFVDD